MNIEQKLNILKFRINFLENQIRDTILTRNALHHFAMGLVQDVNISQAEALRLYNEYGPFIAKKQKDLDAFRWELEYIESLEKIA